MSDKVTVYETTSAYCAKCKTTQRILKSKGIPFEVKAVEDQPDGWLEAHKSEGRMVAPIVTIEYESGGEFSWSDLRPDVIGNLEVK